MMLLKLLGRDLWQNWPTFRKNMRKSLLKWRNDFFTELSKLLLLSVVVGIGFGVVLYYLNALWAVFAETPMGNIFATEVSPGIVQAITATLKLDLSHVAIVCVRNTLVIAVPVGVVLKFSGLYRLAFQNRGYLGLIFWGVVCAAVSGQILPIVARNSPSLQGNAVIYLLPTWCLLTSSFDFSARLAPEFTVVFQFLDFLRGRLRIIKIRDFPYGRQEF